MPPLFVRHLGILFSAALVSTAAPSPTYPLSGIVQLDPRESQVSPTPLSDAVSTVRMIYNDESAALRAARDARQGAKPPAVVYMGGFTSNYEDVLWLEQDHRRGIGMTPVAKLAGDLTATTTEFQLNEPHGGELAVVASTAEGADPADRTRYCYWIRVGDELMKVIAVDAASGRVKVERGFDRSRAVAHNAGARVFGPVYLGNRARLTARASAAWPGAIGRIRYALNPADKHAQQFKARCVVEFMNLGYDGAWWDTFQPQPYNICDALGRKVDFVWDFRTGQPYDFRSYLDTLKLYLNNVRTLVKQTTGREPVLYANSVSASYARGSSELFNSGEESRLLDGYCFEDSYLDPTPLPGAKPGDFRDSRPPMAKFDRVTGTKWLRNVLGQADAARRGVHALCMVGPAGYLAARFNPDLPEYAEFLRYSYASYLLTVTSQRSTSFGLPLLVKIDQRTKQNTAETWPAIVFTPIGEPLQSNEIESLKIPGTACYAREFSTGYVAVYPESEGEPVELDVPAGMIDASTKKPVTHARLAPGDALVLVKADM